MIRANLIYITLLDTVDKCNFVKNEVSPTSEVQDIENLDVEPLNNSKGIYIRLALIMHLDSYPSNIAVACQIIWPTENNQIE